MSVHDPTGTIVFYNESAEAAFGVTFDEMGELSAAEWTARYSPEEADGTPIPLEELPVGVALKERRPAHRTVCFTRPDNVGYVAEVTAFPLMGREEELVGAVRIFWDDAASPRRRVSGPPDVAAEQDGMARHAGPKDLVLILAREFASNLATPIYLADADGTVVYFNEPAERIGGRSFAEAGEMSIRQWAGLLRPRTVDGAPLSVTRCLVALHSTSGAPLTRGCGSRPRRRRAGDRDDGVPAVRAGRGVPRDHGHLLGTGIR